MKLSCCRYKILLLQSLLLIPESVEWLMTLCFALSLRHLESGSICNWLGWGLGRLGKERVAKEKK